MKYYIILSMLIISCSTSNKIISKTQDKRQSLIVQQNYKPAKDNTPFKILDVDLKKNLLTIYLEYTGGCSKHLFKLYTDKIYKSTDPPKIDLFLEHNPNGDLCKSLIMDTMIYDITNAKFPEKEKNFSVELNLNEYSGKIIYKY